MKTPLPIMIRTCAKRHASDTTASTANDPALKIWALNQQEAYTELQRQAKLFFGETATKPQLRAAGREIFTRALDTVIPTSSASTGRPNKNYAILLIKAIADIEKLKGSSSWLYPRADSESAESEPDMQQTLSQDELVFTDSPQELRRRMEADEQMKLRETESAQRVPGSKRASRETRAPQGRDYTCHRVRKAVDTNAKSLIIKLPILSPHELPLPLSAKKEPKEEEKRKRRPRKPYRSEEFVDDDNTMSAAEATVAPQDDRMPQALTRQPSSSADLNDEEKRKRRPKKPYRSEEFVKDDSESDKPEVATTRDKSRSPRGPTTQAAHARHDSALRVSREVESQSPPLIEPRVRRESAKAKLIRKTQALEEEVHSSPSNATKLSKAIHTERNESFPCWDHGCNGKTFSNRSNLSRHQKNFAEAMKRAAEDTTSSPRKSLIVKLKVRSVLPQSSPLDEGGVQPPARKRKLPVGPAPEPKRTCLSAPSSPPRGKKVKFAKMRGGCDDTSKPSRTSPDAARAEAGPMPPRKRRPRPSTRSSSASINTLASTGPAKYIKIPNNPFDIPDDRTYTRVLPHMQRSTPPPCSDTFRNRNRLGMAARPPTQAPSYFYEPIQDIPDGPDIPPLPRQPSPLALASFITGASLALDNILEDRRKKPAAHFLDLVKNLEDNRPNFTPGDAAFDAVNEDSTYDYRTTVLQGQEWACNALRQLHGRFRGMATSSLVATVRKHVGKEAEKVDWREWTRDKEGLTECEMGELASLDRELDGMEE